MVKSINKIASRFVSVLDMPSDIVLELPRIAMSGNREMLIENHKGIKLYTEEQICLRYKGGQIDIYGQKLKIRFIEKRDIKLEGIIKSIEFTKQ